MIKSSIFALGILLALGTAKAQTQAWQPAPGHVQVPIWPGPVPDARPVPGPEYATNMPATTAPSWVSASNVSRPTMTVYSPKEKNTGVAMIVFPGGGYQILAMDIEGTEICDWLNSQGITAVLLKYRVPVKREGPYGESPPAIEDAQRTLGLVRYHAAQWQINPHKIGVIGFSAGGHMVAAVSTHFDKRLYRAVDAADQVSCRPDFAMALYPGHLYNEDEGFKLNPNVPVTHNTPTTFIVQNEDDPVDDVRNSIVYYLALKEAKVPVEMHLFAAGGHAFGLRRKTDPVKVWPQLAETWLRTIGMISAH